MPKIIDVDKKEIMDITRKLIEEKRYDEINCRKIAKIAGIGLGTIYNYFDSKTTILALIMLEDWMKYINKVNTNSSIKEGLRSLYNNIKEFSEKYYDLWEYEKKSKFEYFNFVSRRSKVISQIGEVLRQILQFNKTIIDDEAIWFVSDNIARYASQLYDYNKLEKIFINIIGGNK